MGAELLLFMVVLIGGMFVMNYFAKKSAKKRQEEQEKTMKEQMVPGAWVQTYSGFFGRFVDLDGDVVILETPGGEETYWARAAIRAVTDPPFEDVAAAAVEDSEDGSADIDYDFDKAEAELQDHADGQEISEVDVTETVIEESETTAPTETSEGPDTSESDADKK